MLERCPRQYWFHYYGSRGGWREEAAPETREVFRLKKLVGRSQWLGQLVHEAAARVLTGVAKGRPQDLREVRERLLRGAHRDIERAREDRLRGRPQRSTRYQVGFELLEYQEDPGDEAWRATLDDLAQRFDDLMVHPVMRRLRQVPERMIEIDRLLKVTLDGVGLYVAPDVLVDDGEGGRVIVDWKTGTSHDPDQVARQMAVYAWWVQHEEGLSADQIRGLQANVPGSEHLTVQFTDAHIHEIRDLARTSVARMVDLLEDPSRDEAAFDAFEPLPEGDGACQTCRFRAPCGRTGSISPNPDI